ncbi:hemerythrin domain-containing protein [Sphaerisporangium corydalis]|uniref:Hemerythrin domain-containing protein n=1 Tax=Sphaerisporangium corydalis TaxID=1441875 RepID=A0ABV9ELB0_9ACTN|nr:hemerythrin domain-containing protein [Sphaerisporangium corydalis]
MTIARETVDTQEMVVVHRALRREARLLAGLVAAVAPGDTGRARVLAGHFGDYRLGLRNHHEGEDELLWPLLLARVDLDAEVVLRMEAQHERIAATLGTLDAAMAAWRRAAGADERDALVAALVQHRAVLVEHLDDEEDHLLPLAARHLSPKEWQALGEHLVANTPKPTLLTLFGLVLEDADAGERAMILAGLPWPVRMIWHAVGRPRHARRMRRVRG